MCTGKLTNKMIKFLQRLVNTGGGDKYFIEAAKDNIDDWCKFEAFDYNGKLALKGRSGHFLTRWGPHDLMAAKEGIDEYCLFVPGTGDIIPPTFEIISVSWDSDRSSIVQNPSVVCEFLWFGSIYLYKEERHWLQQPKEESYLRRYYYTSIIIVQ